jgi:hypothetical protein
MPPPAILRTRFARATSSFEPTSAEPTGAPRPLLKHTETLSNRSAMARASAYGSVPLASACTTAALKTRAPSRCVASPWRRASAVASRR